MACKNRLLCLLLAVLLLGTLVGCGAGGAGSGAESVGFGASGGVDGGAVASPYPAPVLTLYEKDYISAILGYADDQGNLIDLADHIPVHSEYFASKEILAGIWSDREEDMPFVDETTLVKVAVSNTDGKSWKLFTLPSTPGVIPEGYQIGFTTEKDGWAVYYGYSGKETATEVPLFTTKDGGATWQHVSTNAFVNLTWVVFASPTIGFAVQNSDSNKWGEQLLETLDGGMTWQAAEIAALPEMQNGASFESCVLSLPYWRGDRWEIGISVEYENYLFGSIGFGSFGYSYFPNANGKWVWNDEGWTLPEGVNNAHFRNFLQNLIFDHNFTPEKGFEKGAYFYRFVAYYYSFFNVIQMQEGYFEDAATGMYYYDCILPASCVEKMAEYLYGDTELDATQLPEYVNELGGIPNKIYDSSPVWNDFVIYSVTTNEQGDIELIWDHNFGADGPSPRYDDGYVPQYEKCVFRPVTTEEGMQLFTLISVEKVDAP